MFRELLMITQLIREYICQNNRGYAMVISNPQSPPNSLKIPCLKVTNIYSSCILQTLIIIQRPRLKEASPSWNVIIWDIPSWLPWQWRGCWRVSQQQFYIHMTSAHSTLAKTSHMTLPSDKQVSWSSSPSLDEEVNQDGWIIEVTTSEADLELFATLWSCPSEGWFNAG